MTNPTPPSVTPQGFGFSTSERIPLPERDAMSEAQQA